MKIQQIFSKEKLGITTNQDKIGVNKNKRGVWVIDGVSEIVPIQPINGENAVIWFINEINDYLIQNIDQMEFTISEIVLNAVKEVKKQFESLTAVDVDSLNPHEQPSASIIITRNIQNRTLELFSLGDCIAYLPDCGKLIQNYELKKQEEQFLKKIFIERKDYPKLSLPEFLEKISIFQKLKQLREDLAQCNQYHVLNLNPSTINKGLKLSFHSVNSILLMSDGFSRVIDTYHLFKDYNDFIVNLKAVGVERIFKKMRTLEQNDPDAQKYPRLTVSDDASLILATIE